MLLGALGSRSELLPLESELLPLRCLLFVSSVISTLANAIGNVERLLLLKSHSSPLLPRFEAAREEVGLSTLALFGVRSCYSRALNKLCSSGFRFLY